MVNISQAQRENQPFYMVTGTTGSQIPDRQGLGASTGAPRSTGVPFPGVGTNAVLSSTDTDFTPEPLHPERHFGHTLPMWLGPHGTTRRSPRSRPGQHSQRRPIRSRTLRLLITTRALLDSTSRVARPLRRKQPYRTTWPSRNCQRGRLGPAPGTTAVNILSGWRHYATADRMALPGRYP